MTRSDKFPSEKGPSDRKTEAADIKKGYLQLLLRVIIIAAAAFVVLKFGFAVIQVSGNEMFPSVKDGDLVIAYRLQKNYYKDDPVVYTVNGKKKVGRIAACGGDVVRIKESGELFVNGTMQSGEIYFPTYPGKEGETEIRVPQDSVFILGDYRTKSTDSRDFGAIPEEHIIGKIITVMRRRGI